MLLNYATKNAYYARIMPGDFISLLCWHKICMPSARSTEEKRIRRRRKKKKNAKSRFFTSRGVRKLALNSNVIHLFDWKSAIEHDGGV